MESNSPPDRTVKRVEKELGVEVQQVYRARDIDLSDGSKNTPGIKGLDQSTRLRKIELSDGIGLSSLLVRLRKRMDLRRQRCSTAAVRLGWRILRNIEND